MRSKDRYQQSRLLAEKDDFFKEGSPKNIFFHNIKKQYEDFIQILEDLLHLNESVIQKLAAVVAEESTKRNFGNYRSSLSTKLDILKDDNKRLKEALQIEKDERKYLKQKHDAVLEAKKCEHFKGNVIMGMTDMKLCELLHMKPGEWADPDMLKEKLQYIQKRKRELEDDLEFRFTTEDKYKSLFQTTIKKEIECDSLGLINHTLKSRVKRLKLAIEAAQISAYHDYSYTNRNSQSMSAIVDVVLGSFGEDTEDMKVNVDACHDEVLNSQNTSPVANVIQHDTNVDSSLKNSLGGIERPRLIDRKSFFDDDPAKGQEAEMTMDYIERFSLLFTSKKFEEAAFRAIYSPKGVLRTPQTLKYFKEVDTVLKKRDEKHVSYLLHYCTLLMSTIDVVGKQPSTWEILESFKCAISEERIDLVEYWLTKGQVEPVEVIGHLLIGACKCPPRKCSCKNVMLAEVVFKRLMEYHQVVHVMMHQGRYATALSYAKTNAKFSMIDFARLLEDEETSNEVMYLMSTLHAELNLEEIIVILVTSGHKENAFMLTKQCVDNNRPLTFGYKNFSHWNGKDNDAEQFGLLCLQAELEETAYNFVSSLVLWSAVENGLTALDVTSR